MTIMTFGSGDSDDCIRRVRQTIRADDDSQTVTVDRDSCQCPAAVTDSVTSTPTGVRRQAAAGPAGTDRTVLPD